MSVKRYRDVLRVIKVAGQDFLDAGKWTTVTKWIEALPPDIRMLEPDIKLFYAQSLIHLGKTDEAGRILTDLLRTVKARSSLWVHQTFQSFRAFAWQEGYAVFSVSKSAEADVKRYIENQADHHRKPDFKEELLALLRAHAVDFDERYVFD